MAGNQDKPSPRRRFGALIPITHRNAEPPHPERAAERSQEDPKSSVAPVAPVEGETQQLDPIGEEAPAAVWLGRVTDLWRNPTQRQWLLLGVAAIVLILALILVPPLLGGLIRQTATPGEAGAGGEANNTSLRDLLFAALPLLLGLFWLLSAWLVDSEARRAFVIQEPWGERRTVAYTTLAVGCVFPLILAGLIFAAWGFVTFVLHVAQRQSMAAGLQAGAIILLICAGFLLLRGVIARWLESRRRPGP